MNAFEIPGHSRFSLDAASAIELRRFVKVNANGKAEYATAATDPIVGVSYTSVEAADQPVAIVGDGLVMVEASAAITAGAFVGPTANGKAVTGGPFVALTTAKADGDLITVDLNATGAAGSTGLTGTTGGTSA